MGEFAPEAAEANYIDIIYKESELTQASAVEDCLPAQTEGNRTVTGIEIL